MVNMASRKRELTASGTTVVLILMLSLSACTRQLTPDQELRYDISFYPEEYTPTERIVGMGFAVEFGLKITINVSEGKTEYAVLGRSVEIVSPPDDPRPILHLRIAGPNGAIERTFLLASGYGNSVFLPQEDVEALGLPGHAAPAEVLLVRGDEQRKCHQASLEVEFPVLSLKRPAAVIWKPQERK